MCRPHFRQMTPRSWQIWKRCWTCWLRSRSSAWRCRSCRVHRERPLLCASVSRRVWPRRTATCSTVAPTSGLPSAARTLQPPRLPHNQRPHLQLFLLCLTPAQTRAHWQWQRLSNRPALSAQRTHSSSSVPPATSTQFQRALRDPHSPSKTSTFGTSSRSSSTTWSRRTRPNTTILSISMR